MPVELTPEEWVAAVVVAVHPALEEFGGRCLVAVSSSPWEDRRDVRVEALRRLARALEPHQIMEVPVRFDGWDPTVMVRESWRFGEETAGESRLGVPRFPGLTDGQWQVYERLVLDGMCHDEALEAARLLTLNGPDGPTLGQSG